MTKKGLPFLFAILGLGILASGTVGCSVLGTAYYLQAKVNSTGWVPLTEDPIGPYKLEREGVNVIVCSNGRGPWTISFGPMLLPVIPSYVIYYKPLIANVNFWLQVGIESPKDTSIVDLSKIRIELPDGRSLTPIKVFALETDEEYAAACSKSWYKGRSPDVGLFALSGERTFFTLEFDIHHVPSKDLKAFMLDLGSLTVDDMNIKLPPLEYSRVTKLKYRPFFLPLPH